MLSGQISRKGLVVIGCSLAVAAGMSFFFPPTWARGQPTEKDKAALEALMEEAKKDLDDRLAKDSALKALAAEYPPVILYAARYEVDGNRHYAFSFSDEPTDSTKTVPDPQIRFGWSDYAGAGLFDVNTTVTQWNLVADLGPVDFKKDPNPKAVDVSGGGQYTWMPDRVPAVEGDVYLERVRDLEGNRFFVLFKVVALDKKARYMAFIWRKLAKHAAPPPKTGLEAIMAIAKKDVDKIVSKDPELKELAAKYPPVILHSRRYVADGNYLQSAYSFNNETSDESKHGNEVQLLFDNGRREPFVEINMLTGQSNLIADLGKADFTVNPDPEDVDINGDGQHTWFPHRCEAIEGHVYLERIWDDYGNRFFVLFKVVAVDDDARYMAFLWRRLPGGKVVTWPHK